MLNNVYFEFGKVTIWYGLLVKVTRNVTAKPQSTHGVDQPHVAPGPIKYVVALKIQLNREIWQAWSEDFLANVHTLS